MQVPVLVLLGFFAISITPVIMALVQENFPENRALANGIYMALSFLLRSAGILVLGIIADQSSLRLTFMISAVLVVVGLPFILMLPKSKPVME